MELQVKTVVCPNCGANSTNLHNCEYCGSLLVRFVDKGIDISNTSYNSEDNVYPGLLTELRNNLRLQLENPNEKICTTDIFWPRQDGGWGCLSIGRSMSSNWADNSPMELGSSHNGLIVAVGFDTYCDTYYDQKFSAYNKEMDEQLSKFRMLKSFELFTSHTSSFKDVEGYSRCGREYAIDFGNDAEGASALISEILSKVMGLKPSDSFDIFTNIGADKVEQARNAWYASHGATTLNSGCIAIVVIILIWALFFIFAEL